MLGFIAKKIRDLIYQVVLSDEVIFAEFRTNLQLIFTLANKCKIKPEYAI